jgi:hypothetical protein
MQLNPTIVSRALPIVASVLGIDPVSNRNEALTYLNRIRALWYHEFHRLRLFDDLMECVEIQKFRHDCSSNCPCDCFQGISLPTYMEGPVAAWMDSAPLTLRSRWKAKDAGTDNWGPGLDLLELSGHFPTFADMGPDSDFLKLTSLSKKDQGKKLIVRGRGCKGEPIEIAFTITGSGTTQSVQSIAIITAVILPDLCGGVTLSELTSGRTLAQYTPSSPTVPTFRRFRLQGGCGTGCQPGVQVQASRSYSDLYFDDDIVEIGDRLVLEFGARHYLYGERTTDRSEIARGKLDRDEMFDKIRGMLARRKGGHIQDGNPLNKGSRQYGTKLPGYGGRRTRHW